MRTELKDRAGSLEYINHAGQDLLRKASTDQSTQKLRADLENLNARWNKVLSEIEDRYTKFTSASEQQKHLRVLHIFNNDYLFLLTLSYLVIKPPLATARAA